MTGEAKSDPRPLHRLFELSCIDFFQGTPVTAGTEIDLSLKQQFLDAVLIRKGKEPIPRPLTAELSLLFTLEDQRRRTLAHARHRLWRGEWRTALESAEHGDWLRGDEKSQRLAAMTHLLRWRLRRGWGLSDLARDAASRVGRRAPTSWVDARAG
jgi:hypothetical protein